MEQSQEKSTASIRAERQPKHKKIVRWLWIATIVGLIGTVLLFVALSFSDLPSFEELENPKYDTASQVYSADGEVFGRYYVENRVPVSFEELSPNVKNALIATEDERYHRHSGIDLRGLVRAIFFVGKRGGASTITQQLAKLLFTGSPASGFERIMQKFKEWIIAVRLERKYTKEEIMAMYLNKFDFLYEADGIKAASEVYFNKDQADLFVEEAAMLVGMLKNPSQYNPKRYKDHAMKRREVVLKQMQRNELLSQVQYDSLRVIEFDDTNFTKRTHNTGLAPYFRMVLGEEIKRILKDENLSTRRPDGKPFDIYRDGLKIYTTIDPIIQEHLEASALEHMKKLQKTYWNHWKNLDEWTYREEETTDEEIEIRARSLNKFIFSSNRAQNIRKKSLDAIVNTIKSTIDGFTLRDIDIERMLAEEEDRGTLRRLVKKKLIGTKLQDKYRTVMRGEHWKDLKRAWDTYQDDVLDNFDEEVKMKVFTYDNDKFEKDTTMTPLDSIKYHRSFLQIGSMAVDPKTGDIKAWVGGINHKYFQYDHVTSDRQVGSTFKPFIYSTAIEQTNISPCYEIDDIPYTIHQGEGTFNLLKDWTPENANGEYSGERYSLYRGLMTSKNTVSVYLMKEVIGSVAPVRNLAKNVGIPLKKVPEVPSICLGSADLSVFDMTGAYTAFANNGNYNKPVYIRKIEDKYGREIYKSIPDNNPAIHPYRNFVMIDMLRKVMQQGQPNFHGLKSDIGGKTGTTNDYVDGWFMGITPNLICGTWVGGEDRWTRFRTLSLGIGARMARPVFAKLMHRIEKDENVDYDAKTRFHTPAGDIGIELDCEMYNALRGGGWGDEDESFEDEGFGDEFDQAIPPQDSTNMDEEDEEEFGEEFNE